MRGEGLAVVGLTPGVHPGADPLRVAERARARSVSRTTIWSKNSWGNPRSKSLRVAIPGASIPNRALTTCRAPPAEAGVPLAQRLHVAGDGAVHPVEAAVPEVVLGQDEVEAVRQAGVVVPAEPLKAARWGPAATRMGRRAPPARSPAPGRRSRSGRPSGRPATPPGRDRSPAGRMPPGSLRRHCPRGAPRGRRGGAGARRGDRGPR